MGGNGGRGFQQDRISQRQVIKKLEVWSSERGLTRIEVTFTDGTVETVGALKDSYQGSFEIDYSG